MRNHCHRKISFEKHFDFFVPVDVGYNNNKHWLCNEQDTPFVVKRVKPAPMHQHAKLEAKTNEPDLVRFVQHHHNDGWQGGSTVIAAADCVPDGGSFMLCTLFLFYIDHLHIVTYKQNMINIFVMPSFWRTKSKPSEWHDDVYHSCSWL